MINAFVLVSAEPSHVPELAEALVSIDAVAEVYSVAGDLADIVAVLRVREHEELADVVTGKIASLAGVRSTTTLIAFRAYSRQDLEALWDLGRDDAGHVMQVAPMMRGKRDDQRLARWKQESDETRRAEQRRRIEQQTQASSAVPPAWPPPTRHPPLAECVLCGSKDLVETRDSAVMFTVKDRPDAHYVEYSTLLNIVACRKCGRLELFANDPVELLSSYQHGAQAPLAPEPAAEVVADAESEPEPAPAGGGQGAPPPPVPAAVSDAAAGGPATQLIPLIERPDHVSASAPGSGEPAGAETTGEEQGLDDDHPDVEPVPRGRMIEKIDRGPGGR